MELFMQTTDGVIFFIIFILLVVWSITWKGLALWKSARLSDKWWFIALLVINTIGILEILYLFIFSKRNKKEKG